MHRLRTLLAVLSLFIFGASVGWAADPAGQWTWTMQNPRGPQEARATFVFKDGVLTGTVTGRLGEAPLEHATFEDDKIAFSITRKAADGQQVVLKFKGTLAGDTITGTIERPPANDYDAPALLTWHAARQRH